MMAGIVYMLSQHKTLLEAVQLGVACGTAAILKQGAGLFHPADVWRFYEWIKNHTHVGTPPIKITGL
jgi:6-phosphofructokinase 2